MYSATGSENFGYFFLVFTATVGLEVRNTFTGFVFCIGTLSFKDIANRFGIFAGGKVYPAMSQEIINEHDKVQLSINGEFLYT